VSRRTLFLTLLAALTFFAGLGRGAITDSDEAFYAEAAREMIETGDWLTPTFNYQTRFQKPVLYYWLTAATYLVAGVTEAAARFWSACAGLGLVLVTASAARRWFDERTSLVAGAITATTFGYFAMARAALPDLPLAFFITLATFASLVAMGEEQRRRRWVIVAAGSMALGMLTKGPVAVVLPALVVGALLLIERRRPRISGADLVAGASVLVLIAAPWYLAMWLVHGTGYVYGFFVGDNFERFATARFNEPRPWWFYAPVIAGGLLPWTPMALVWLAPTWRFLRRQHRLGAIELRLLLWAVLPLLFYTMSIGKQPRYVLPVLPPMAILLAASIVHRTHDWPSSNGIPIRRSLNRSVVVGCGLSGIVLMGLGLLLHYLRGSLAHEVGGMDATLAAVLIGVAGAVVVGVSASPAWPKAPLAIALAAAVSLTALHFGALSSAGEDSVEQMARLVHRERRADEAVTAYEAFVRNLVFYTRIRQEEVYSDEQFAAFLGRPERVLAVVPLATLERVGRDRHVTHRRLAELPYFDSGALRLSMLVSSGPPRSSERVVLVTNK
jgi:4-amino-4-deoxy-L-arabinose transferase-like glycosyltransferase